MCVVAFDKVRVQPNAAESIVKAFNLLVSGVKISKNEKLAFSYIILTYLMTHGNPMQNLELFSTCFRYLVRFHFRKYHRKYHNTNFFM